jgi:hypothetical protein
MIVKTVHGGDPNQKSTALLAASLMREFEKRQIERAEKRATATTRSKLISERRSAFQCDMVLRARIGNFRPNHAIREWLVENRPF